MELAYGDGGTTGPGDRRSKFGTIGVNDNQWHFVAGVIRGPTDMDIWIDCNYDPGTYANGGSGGNLFYNANDGRSGIEDVVSGIYYYTGSIDEVRLYHRELTQTDLVALYNFPTTGAMSVSLGSDTTLCNNASTILTANTTGGPTNYLWSTGATTPSINVSTSGTYWVQVTGTCAAAIDSVNVAFDQINLSLNLDTTVCFGETIQLNSPIGFVNYLWSPSAGLSCTSCSNPFVIVGGNSTYTLTVADSLCSVSAPVNIGVYNTSVYAGPDQIILQGSSAQLIASGGQSYTWTPLTTLNSNVIFNPLATPQSTTTYTVYSVDQHGCTSSDEVVVQVEDPCKHIFFPDAFTPNKDGRNDEFRSLLNINSAFKLLRVYNRWGQKVFETSVESEGWDGTFQEVEQEIGTYVYYAEYFCGGNTVFVKGNVTLMR